MMRPQLAAAILTAVVLATCININSAMHQHTATIAAPRQGVLPDQETTPTPAQIPDEASALDESIKLQNPGEANALDESVKHQILEEANATEESVKLQIPEEVNVTKGSVKPKKTPKSGVSATEIWIWFFVCFFALFGISNCSMAVYGITCKPKKVRPRDYNRRLNNRLNNRRREDRVARWDRNSPDIVRFPTRPDISLPFFDNPSSGQVYPLTPFFNGTRNMDAERNPAGNQRNPRAITLTPSYAESSH